MEVHHAKLPGWAPSRVRSFTMEFLYYLTDPLAMLAEIQENWMEPGAFWSRRRSLPRERGQLGLAPGAQRTLTTLSQEEWRQGMTDAGFIDVETSRVGLKDGFVGTLALFGRKPVA